MADEIVKVANNIKRLSKMTAYKINMETEKPSIFDSKFGGLPYWTEDMEYPRNSQGIKLLLLAQINFDKYKFNSPLPDGGMLQFFICCNDLYGLNFKNQLEQDGFRIIYHDKVNYNITEESVKKLGIPASIKDIDNKDNKSYYFPIYKETKLSFHEEIDTINENNKDFNKYFTTAYNMVYDNYITVNDEYYKVLDDEHCYKLCDMLNSKIFKHKILGYPNFTQKDRRIKKEYLEHNVLLLQIGSSKNIMWGDCGVCNFFITEKALLEKDFTNVLYNWDCC